MAYAGEVEKSGAVGTSDRRNGESLDLNLFMRPSQGKGKKMHGDRPGTEQNLERCVVLGRGDGPSVAWGKSMREKGSKSGFLGGFFSFDSGKIKEC
jgi:hypothetical protein